MAVTVEEGIREKTLQASKCEKCGTVSFPAMIVCPKCGPTYTSFVKLFELPSVGTVTTWTKLWVAPKGFPSPLLLCVADFGVVKILGTVYGVSELHEGEKVAIVEDKSGKFPFVFYSKGVHTKLT